MTETRLSPSYLAICSDCVKKRNKVAFLWMYDGKKRVKRTFFAVFRKKRLENFVSFGKSCTFALAFGKEVKKVSDLTTKFLHRNGRLAQLVQSICLTSRGSAVRIRQRPRKSDENHSLHFISVRLVSSTE